MYLRGRDCCERGHNAVITRSYGMDLQLGGYLRHESIRSLISVIDRAFPALVPVMGLSRMTLRNTINTIGGSASGTWFDPVLWKRTPVADSRVGYHHAA